MPRPSLTEDLGERLLALAGVELRRSRFADREAFWVGRREVAHFHPDRELDVRLTRREISRLRADLEADPRVTLRRGSDWVAFRFRRRADLDRAVALVAAAVAANG